MKIPFGLQLKYSFKDQSVTGTASLDLKRGRVVFDLFAKNLNPHGTNENEEFVIKSGDKEIVKLNKDSQISSEELAKLPDQAQAGLLLFSVIGEHIYGFYAGAIERFERDRVGNTAREAIRWFGAEVTAGDPEERRGTLQVKPEQLRWFDSFPVVPVAPTIQP